MQIYAVCGMGIGTSVLLKANAEKVLAQLEIEASVRATSIADALAAESPAQIVLTTPELVEQLAGLPAEVVSIDNVFDLAEIQEKLERALL